MLRRARVSGFTLLELLVVLLLLGLVYALAGISLDAGGTGVDMKAGVRQIAAGLRKARATAVAEQRETTLTLDVERRIFQVTGDPRTYDLPGRLEFTLFTAQSEVLAGKTASIRFFPDGSSTGGRVTVASGSARQTVDVDWLTGRVKLS